MYTESRDALQLRDTVLAIVAHDIRTPLSTILMTTQLLEDDRLSKEQRTHFIGIIRRASSHIERLIHDLVDISRIENSQLFLERVPTRLHRLLTDIVDSHRPMAEARSITLRLDMPDVDPVIDLDRERIAELLGNLLTNALKFTPRGGAVTVLCIPSADTVKISVADTGVGIPEEELEHIFERFWQAEHARRAGAGLGLAISKGIVEAHGGTISVNSRVGQGSTFHVVLPCD